MKELIKMLETKAQREKATQVVRQVRTNIYIKNYFGWRHFIEDVVINVIGYMITTKFEYSSSAYISWGMQSALDSSRYCNAKCRRGNYETISLDADDSFLQVEDESANFVKKMEMEERCDTLYEAIVEEFGKELAEQLKPLIYGDETKLHRKVLEKCKTEEFKEFLQEMAM